MSDEHELGHHDMPDGEEPIEIEITDTFDLHFFRPSEIKDVVRDYVDAAYEKGLRELRLIHGRGIGVQREAVRKVLSRDERVVSISDAPGGNWGATVVVLD